MRAICVTICFLSLVSVIRAAEPTPEELKSLLNKLASQDEATRASAAKILSSHWSRAEDAVPPIKRLSDDPDPQVRIRAAVIVAQIAPAEIPSSTQLLLQELKHPDAAVRKGAVEGLTVIRPRATTVLPALIKVREEDESKTVRGVAAVACAFADPNDAVHIVKLANLLEDEEVKLQELAAKFLLILNRFSRPAIPAMTAALHEKQPAKVRCEILQTLMFLGPAAQSALPAIRAAVRDDDSAVRRQAAVSLAFIEPKSRDVVPEIMEALKSDIKVVRNGAAIALSKIRPLAREAVPALIAALKDEDADVRHYAAVSLAAIDNSVIDGIPVLVEGTRHEDREMRLGSVKSLAGLGANARSTLPTLVEMLKSERDDEVRVYAAASLGMIDPKCTSGVAVLCDALDHQQDSLRLVAAAGLSTLGPRAKDAIPLLTSKLNNGQQSTEKAFAAVVLQGIGEPAIPTLIVALHSEDQQVRALAAHSLGLIRPSAPTVAADVIAALEKASRDKAPRVASTASEALRRTQVAAKSPPAEPPR